MKRLASEKDKEMRSPLGSDLQEELRKNPLVNYLKVFQNQHRVISILYRGLIAAFLGFVLLISFLIFTAFESELIPTWGKTLLVVVDLLVILGSIKAFQELGKYKRNSVNVLNQVYDYLKNDLSKFEKIKSEHDAINRSHKKLQNKILSFSSKSRKPIIEDYSGWDSQVCPKCHTAVEMLEEICPQCQYNLGRAFMH